MKMLDHLNMEINGEKFPANLRSVRVVKVLRVTTCEGSGTPESPSREVTWYFDFAGKLIVKLDPCQESDDG